MQITITHNIYTKCYKKSTNTILYYKNININKI